MVRVHVYLEADLNDKLHLYFDNSPGYSKGINAALKAVVARIENRALDKATSVVTSEDLADV